ncbi:MAG: hypothetical protein LN411_01820 [Candidatus Thermoplasmatota archaeon]|nr:hypothetical protein [Candidatus Thermoplasmatota archaeon]
MTDDLLELLGTLTVAELKSVAEKHGIDVSSCRGKKSYVKVLAGAKLTQRKVKNALDASNKRKDEADREMKEIETDLKVISEKKSETKDVPEDENIGIERSIDKALHLRPLFFEIDSTTEQAWNKMILGDFAEALTLNRNSRSQVIDRLSTFHLYSTALSIRASETILNQMTLTDTKVSSKLKTALAETKKAFMNGPPKRRETTLEELENLTTKAFEAFIDKSQEAENDLRKMLEEYSSFGVHVKGSFELLEIATQAKSYSDIGQYAKLMEQARAQADRAEETRMKEIDSAFENTGAAIKAAKESGAETAEGQARFTNAKKAFKNNEFAKAMEMLASVEQVVDSVHHQRAQQTREAKEIAQITSSLQESEPDLEEAAMYGMDVRDGLLFVRTTKDALQQRDVVTAAKFSRKVRKLTKSMEKDLEKLREKHSAEMKSKTDSVAELEQKGGQRNQSVQTQTSGSASKRDSAPARTKKTNKWRSIIKK